MRPLFGAALLLVAAGLARADGEDPDRAAQGLLNQGIALYQGGDYEGARKLFAAAQAAAPTRANPYRWLGLAEVRLGHCPEARADLDAFLRLAPHDDPRAGETAKERDGCQVPAAPPPNDQPPPSIAPPPPVALATPGPSRPPLVRRPWLWVAVAGAAAVIAAAIALAVVFTPSEERYPGTALGTTFFGPR